MRDLRPRTLTARLAVWIAAIFLATSAVFGIVLYVVVYSEERGEAGRESVETSAEVAEDTEDEVLTALAIAAPLGLALSIAGAIWVARRALAPMKDVIRAATEIDVRQLNRRLPLPAAKDEVYRWVVALNALLGRLEEGFAAQSRFAAAASHELRTPLAVLRGTLEVALRRPRSADEWQKTAGDLLDEVARLQRLVEALLRLRRSEVVEPGELGASDLSSVVEAVVQRAGAVVAATDIPAVRVVGDPDELEVAVGNVVANAVRANPAGRSVRVWAEAEGRVVQLHVEDEGPGLPPGEEERMFAPFVRGAGSDGFGLGLPIARAIVEGTGGTLVAAPSGGDSGAHLVFTFVPEERG